MNNMRLYNKTVAHVAKFGCIRINQLDWPNNCDNDSFHYLNKINGLSLFI